MVHHLCLYTFGHQKHTTSTQNTLAEMIEVLVMAGTLLLYAGMPLDFCENN